MQATIVLARFAFVESVGYFSKPLVLPSKIHHTPPYDTSDDTRGGKKGEKDKGKKGNIREKKVRRETEEAEKRERSEDGWVKAGPGVP